MDRSAMVRSHVETLLEKLTGQPCLKPDGEGDYPVRFEQAVYYVRLLDVERPVVQVFAVAVAGAEERPELFAALNTINRQLRFARTFVTSGKVVFASELLGETIDVDELASACGAVATAADHFGPLIAKEYGGELQFHDVAPTGDSPAADVPGAGGYL